MTNCENSENKPQPGSSKTVRFKEPDILEETIAKVDEVVEIIKENVEKVLIRDTKLVELSSRAQQLKDDSAVFESNAAKLRKKMQSSGTKTKIFLGFILILFVVSIPIVILYPYF